MGALVAASVVLVAALASAVRGLHALYARLRDHPETLAWFTGSGTLWSILPHLSADGLSLSSASAFLAGTGTFLMGVTSLYRELRADRPPPGGRG